MLQIVNKRVAEKDYVITQKRRKLVKKHDYNIGTFFVEFWPKPRVYYLGKLRSSQMMWMMRQSNVRLYFSKKLKTQ